MYRHLDATEGVGIWPKDAAAVEAAAEATMLPV